MVTQKEYEDVDILELRSRKVNRHVCRALWPVNHEQVKKDLEKEQKKMSKHFTQKYNFDFEGGKPIAGKYEWEKTDTFHQNRRQGRPSTLAKRQSGKPTVDNTEEQKKARKSEECTGKETIKSSSGIKKSRTEREISGKRKPRRVRGTFHSQ